MVWWCLGLGGLVLSGWGILSTRRMLYPRPKPIAAIRVSPPVKTVSLVSHDGDPFEVWVVDSREPRGILVACHGYSANRFQLVDIAQGLRQRGYTVLVFDLRGHGMRRGPCTFGVKEAMDLEVILRWVGEQPDYAALPVGLLGFSMGGSITCQATVTFPQVAAVALDSTYAHLFPVLAAAILRDYHLPSIPWGWVTWLGVQVALGRCLITKDPAVFATRAHQPLFLIHGRDDRSVPLEQANLLYAKWHGPKAQWLEPHVGHVGMYAHDPTRYCDRVASFFDRWLHAPSP